MGSNTASKALGYLSGADQRNAPSDPHQQKAQTNDTAASKFEEGQPGSHDILDSKDQRSIANRLAAASQEHDKPSESMRPTEVARSHGNEPSKGAKIDEELQKEDEEYLKRKGKA